MARPVVGIVGNTSLLNDQYPIHAAGTMNTIAVAQVSGELFCPAIVVQRLEVSAHALAAGKNDQVAGGKWLTLAHKLQVYMTAWQ